MIVVFLRDAKMYRRIIPDKDIIRNDTGQYILPRNHFSLGWIERVWGIDANTLPLLEFPTKNEIKYRRIGVAAG